jgi:hypothetical protein
MCASKHSGCGLADKTLLYEQASNISTRCSMLDALSDDAELIAPCGMNCAVCSRYLARKHDVRRKGVRMAYCAGCRPRDRVCASLKKRCDLLLNHSVRFCYECSSFPCRNLERIDARYRKHYRTSFIENLTFVKQHSLAAFIERENAKWRCAQCGGVLCCHNGICFKCGIDRLRTKKQLYRWEDEQ